MGIESVRVTTVTDRTHVWYDASWKIDSDGSLKIYELVEDNIGIGRRSSIIAQFAVGAWALVELVDSDVE